MGSLLEGWNHLVSMLKKAETIVIPRCVFCYVTQLTSIHLVGFCDPSTKANAAVVYMRLESVSSVDVKFLASKTQVAPVGGTTIPQLELLSALLLSKLITSIQTALKTEVHLSNPVCFTDSKAALYWIQGVKHELSRTGLL